MTPGGGPTRHGTCGVSRRIWCELLSPGAVVRAAVLPALAARGVGLLAATGRGETADVVALVRACRDAGVTVGLWPMLTPDEGRWANELTAPRVDGLVRELVEALDEAGALPDELVLDLEPPFELLATPGLASLVRFAGGDRAEGRERLAALSRAVRSRGVRVVAAALPMVLGDGAATRWQRLLATPVDAVEPDHVTAMAYASLIEGYSRGILDRRDTLALLALAARSAARRPGFGLSLGAIGTGSLGDEPVYRSPEELAEEVGLATALGVHELALFSLCGALRRPPLERWLDAFVGAQPSPAVTPTWRARAVGALVAAVGGRRGR